MNIQVMKLICVSKLLEWQTSFFTHVTASQYLHNTSSCNLTERMKLNLFVNFHISLCFTVGKRICFNEITIYKQSNEWITWFYRKINNFIWTEIFLISDGMVTRNIEESLRINAVLRSFWNGKSSQKISHFPLLPIHWTTFSNDNTFTIRWHIPIWWVYTMFSNFFQCIEHFDVRLWMYAFDECVVSFELLSRMFSN